MFTLTLSLTLFIVGDLGAKDYSPGMKVPVKGMVTILDIGAASCIPCKMMAPILEKLEKKYDGKAAVIFLDVRYHKEDGHKFSALMASRRRSSMTKKEMKFTGTLAIMSEEAIVAQFKKMGVE